MSLASAERQSVAEQLAQLPWPDRERLLAEMGTDAQADLVWDWQFWARPDQLEPPGDWSIWLVMAGRGWGKTKAGSEWVRAQVCGDTPLAPGRVRRVALVAETAADARDVMVMGPSGILATHPPDYRPRYVKSDRGLTWPNGAVALLFSAEDPEQLRGPEHEAAWADEMAKWRYAQETWDMLQFGMRIGDRPRQLVTTTPRPIPLVRDLLNRAGKDVVVTRGRTFDNLSNLAPSFLRDVQRRYGGTRLGRQELDGEVIDDVPGALWTRRMLDRRGPQCPLGAQMGPGEPLPDMERVVVAVDPSGTSGDTDDQADDIGIVVAGRGRDGNCYILEDLTCHLGPDGWGRLAVNAYERHRADAITAERNFGGAMVQHVIQTVDRRVRYREVTASRGKVVRAEPVAALYEQGRVRHVGSLATLEDQMCSMSHAGYMGKGSPDRLDAMVWAVTDLMLAPSRGGGTSSVRGHY